MTDTARPTTRRRPGCWVIVTVVVMALVGIPFLITAVNDAAAARVEAQLNELPLPPGAKKVDSLSQAGKLSGNGNGMQYLGAILIRSDQSAAELQSFYEAQATADPLSIEVTTPAELHDLHRAPGFLGDPPQSGTYVVYAWGEGPGGIFEGLDLRGH